MSPIKDFKLIYESPNTDNVFSEGDTVAGAVTLALTKTTKVWSLVVKLKGGAQVCWTEGCGDSRESYSARRKFLNVKEYLVAENPKGTVLPQGAHCFKFRLKIPQGSMPSSFKGVHGKIFYLLEAKVSRGLWWPSGIGQELKFVSKSLLRHGQIMSPQTGSVSREVGIFFKGKVQMSATMDRNVFFPGDTLSVVAKICNSSSKQLRPKFKLKQKTVYCTSGSTNTSEQSLGKMLGDIINAKSEKTISCQMKIPVDATYSVNNCEIISVDYYVKVYLDITVFFDPEVKCPLVVVPSSFFRVPSGEPAGPYQAGGPSYFLPPAVPVGPYPVPGAPGAYGYPEPGHSQHGATTSSYNSQWPQQVPPSGFSSAAYPPSFRQQQDPTAPPPTYASLFPASHDKR